ncbi:MAG: AI-2E family transporter [Lachnospiraceae bacterium]|nr:AI-2E family transporter [Lachnospiraceae bacterium]
MIMNRDSKHNFYLKIGVNGLLIVCGGIFFYYILFHSDKLSALISAFLSILTPIISGLVIAYILNPVMRFLEKKIFYPLWNKLKRKKDHVYSKEKIIIRVLCAFLTLLLFIAMIYGIVISVVPQLVINIQSVLSRIPVYLLNINDYYANILIKYPNLESILTQYSVDLSQFFYNKVRPYFEDIISKTSTSLLGSIVTIFKSLLNFIIGVIISLHLLIDKERFVAQSKKVLYAYLKRERANNFINNLRYTDKIFGGFITGKVIDSIIVGILCYITMLILHIPYTVLISVIVAVTNVIPYFGPFIGAIPSAFFILMVDPKKCLVFLIVIIILQQIDGNVIGPKILGDSTGLNSFWVIFSITVFSGLFGWVGMFFGVPTFAVIYAAFRTLINKRLEIKHMPIETAYYVDSDFTYEEDDKNNTGQSFRFAQKTFERVTKETLQEDEDRANTLTNSSTKDKLLNEKDEITDQ